MLRSLFLPILGLYGPASLYATPEWLEPPRVNWIDLNEALG